MVAEITGNEPAKAKIVKTLPLPEFAEQGELYYDSTNGKLAVWTSEGWKYWTQD